MKIKARYLGWNLNVNINREEVFILKLNFNKKGELKIYIINDQKDLVGVEEYNKDNIKKFFSNWNFLEIFEE